MDKVFGLAKFLRYSCLLEIGVSKKEKNIEK